MKLSWLSFALLWASRLGAEAVTEELRSLPLRPQPDSIQRYFLPGSARMGAFPKFLKLSDGLSLQAIKEELYVGLADPEKVERARNRMQRMIEADERKDLFLELDLRSDWEREELAGKVRTRIDFYPGGMRKKSEVSYDKAGRRLQEQLFDEANQLIFRRRRRYEGAGFTPAAMQVLDYQGVTRNSVSWVLDGRGLPLEEDHKDSQGLPFFHRSYRYDPSGRLISFKESPGAKPRGLRYEFDYDRKGRLKERRAFSQDTLEPVWITQFESDSERILERRELMDRLPLRGNRVTGSGFDPRRELKYRWRFSADQADFYWKRWDGDGNEGFFDARKRYKIHRLGFLTELEWLDKSGQTQSREFWDWNEQGQLMRHDIWGKPGQSAEYGRFEYEFDEKGNWTVKRSFGALEPLERKFEYYND